MKAKEYIAQIDQALADDKLLPDVLHTVVTDLFNDAVYMAINRSGYKLTREQFDAIPENLINRYKVYDHVFIPCLRESDAKWRSIAHARGYNPNGFKDILMHHVGFTI